jgi:hypothetical protein
MSQRMIYFTVLVIVLAFGVFEELYLRRYLFAHQETIVAGSLPNFLAAVICSILFLTIRLPSIQKSIRAVVFIVIGLILYECAQIWMPDRVFDLKDIVASIIGGLFSILVIIIVSGRFRRT